MSKNLLLTFLLFLPYLVQAQTSEESYLYKAGKADSLYSEILKEQRLIYVEVPASFAENEDRKYPVLYVVDGDVFLPALSVVHSYYWGGFMPEMVIIGISNSKNRTRDLTTSNITTKYGMPFNEENGGAAQFHKFLEEELIPYVENNYPVTTYRTLAGHSYGGLFTIYSLLNHASAFENYLAIDPSLDWDDQKLIKQAKSSFSTQDFTGKSLYMSLAGQLHRQNPEITIDNVMEDKSDFTLFARSNIEFKNIIEESEKSQMQFHWEFFKDDLHGTIPLPSFRNGLIALFEWFQMEHTNKFNSPSTPTAEIIDIISYRAKKLEDHFKYKAPPYPEELLNVLGYMSMDMEQPKKSKMFFETAIEFYPASANAYDSMAEYFEKQQDYTNALKFVEKAFEISGSDYHKERMEKLKTKTN